MRFVPANRFEAETRRRLLQYFPAWIANFRPIPSGRNAERSRFAMAQEGDKIDRKTEVVGALTPTRFRSSFGEQVVLPLETAERLEDFEAELKRTGLMKPDEALVQRYSRPDKFRVQPVQVIAADHYRSPAETLLHGVCPSSLRERVWRRNLLRGRRRLF